MKNYTVTNRFHGTSAQTTLSKEEHEMTGYRDGGMMCEQSKEQISINRRAKILHERLCGSPTCECSTMNEWTVN